MPRSWPTPKVYHLAFSVINQDSKPCSSFKCTSLLTILKAPKFLNFQKSCLLKIAYVHLFSPNEKKKIIIVLSLYFGCKSDKHKILTFCAFQNPELARKEAALILKIFPSPASPDRSIFSSKLGSIEFVKILKGKLCVYSESFHILCVPCK